MYRVVVLNGDYTFLNTVDWRKAINLQVKGKTEVVKYSNKEISCSNGKCIKIPSVIKLIKAIRIIYKNKVPYSKKNVMMRDDFECAYCGSKRNLTIDHIIPSSRGGKSCFDNCITACRPCNNLKGWRTPSEAMMHLRKQAYIPTISEFLRLKMKQAGIDTFLKDIGVF